MTTKWSRRWKLFRSCPERTTRRGSRVAWVLAVMSLAAGSACANRISLHLPKSAPTVRPATSTTAALPADYSGVMLPTVEGGTSTTRISNAAGRARLSGRVTGPDGRAVAGATVRAERIVDGQGLAFDVATRPDGSWSVDNVQGGRWRVRAWRSPDLVSGDPLVVYLADNQKFSVDISLDPRASTVVQSELSSDPPTVGQPTVLSVFVTMRVVNRDGVVQSVPGTAQMLQLIPSTDWQVASANPTATGSTGQADWRVVCLSSGSHPLQVVAGGQTYALTVGPCLAPAPPTQPPSTSTTVAATTSTIG